MLQCSLYLKYQSITISLMAMLCFSQCSTIKYFNLPAPEARNNRTTGSQFFSTAISYNWQQRDSFALREMLAGNIPSFLQKMVPVKSTLVDSLGKTHTAVFYVTQDYLSVGTNADWARVPLTPIAAQLIADRWNCFLPTKKIVDLVWQQAKINPEPVPMYAYRDSSITMWQHHLIIEGQRKGRKGLIAGIKKDVVISGMTNAKKADRVAIYGWHMQSGKPIQPLYTGHVNWYVDYSHGIRLVSRAIFINGKEMDVAEVLEHPLFRRLICDDDHCDFYQYATSKPGK